MEWQISSKQKELLDAFFEKIEGKVGDVLDIGSGRTSIFYLTERYKNVVIDGVIYPGDERKIGPIRECVKNDNYRLIETDILNFHPEKKYDVVLAHLFLGEAEKFGGNKFKEVSAKLFAIDMRYLVIVNLLRDDINYGLLLKQISEHGSIVSIKCVVSEEGGEISLGMLIKKQAS